MAETFAQAFAAARKKMGPGKTFKWNGKSYSTNTKEDAAKGGSKPTRPQPRPEAKAPATKPKPRPAAKSESKPAAKPAAPAKPNSTAPSPVKTDVKRETSSGPTVRRGGADTRPKPATNADRMEAAKAEAAARRTKAREAAGITEGKPKPKPAAKPAASGGKLQAIKDFFNGGGLAGKWAREKKAKG